MIEDNALKETLEILLHFEIGRNEVQKYLETFKNARELQIQHFSGDSGVEESFFKISRESNGGRVEIAPREN